MYAFIVGFNEWVLKTYVKDKRWRRTRSKNAFGWDTSERELMRELKTVAAFQGMGPGTAKLYVVKPQKRGGYMPDKLMTEAIKEAKRLGIGIVDIEIVWGVKPEREAS